MRTLLVNAIITPDGTLLESLHRHDYRSHIDANGESYFIDGGLDYVRRSLNHQPALDACVYNDSGHEVIRNRFKWGTRGKDGKSPLTWVELREMSDDHIKAILKTQQHISDTIRKVFVDELTYRKSIK
jgi:hypothetical protein